MACYHPMYGLRTGDKTKNGKDVIKIVGHTLPQGWPPDKVVQIPCGKCIGCRLEYSRQWANRCMLELQYHDSAYFCTFTYDDEHVPVSYHTAEDTGEAFPGMTLRKRDMQLLLKRIRKRFSDDKIRFYGAGEYGSHTFRPHYHIILFGLHLNDLEVYKQSRLGDTYYISPSLSKCWCDRDGNPLGYVVVAPVTWETCAYVARYTSKKWTVNDGEVFQSLGLEEPFVLMSRRPGIGRQYYEDHPEMFQYAYINVSTDDGGRKFPPPKYYETLLERDDPELFAQRKLERKISAVKAEKVADRHSQLDKYDRLALAERVKAGQIKSLRRSVI